MNHQEENELRQAEALLRPLPPSKNDGRMLEYIHGKDSDEADASSSGGAAPPVEVRPPPEEEPAVVEVPEPEPEPIAEEPEEVAEVVHEHDPHEQDAHQGPTEPEFTEEELKAAYENKFPPEPETPGPVTTFSLFSDPDAFDGDSIANKRHYVKDDLEGTLWLDANADGIRGSPDGDRTVNAAEYDTGIGGVTVQLVSCDDDTPAETKISLPNNGVGGATTVLRTRVPEAGDYDFPNLAEGRYYVMYKAPTNYRISGSVLPLRRDRNDDNSFECVPYGGEGDEYRQQIEERGDLDWGGYCARSVGCLEVGKHFDLVGKFSDRVYLEEGKEAEDYIGTSDNIVAIPEEHFLNVGLAEEEWPLSTVQYADSQISLSFPGTVTADDLEAAVPEDFEGSEVKNALEEALKRVFSGGSGAFDIEGVDLHGGEIQEASSDEESEGVDQNPTSRRRLRGLQMENGATIVQDPSQAQAAPEAPSTKVTYTLTSRGKYRPPPYEQLGTILSDSINSDPQGLVKSLKDREASALPAVFEEVADVKSRHLTVKTEKPQVQPGPIGEVQEFSEAGESSSKIDSWATVPIILCAIMIAILSGFLLFRRVFVRRVKEDKRHHLTTYLKKGSGFAVSKYDPDEDKKECKLRDEPDPLPRDPSGFKPSGDLGDGTYEMKSTDETDPESPGDDDGEERRRERRRPQRRASDEHTASNTTRSVASGSVASRSVSTQGSGASSRASSRGHRSNSSANGDGGHRSRSNAGHRSHSNAGHRQHRSQRAAAGHGNPQLSQSTPAGGRASRSARHASRSARAAPRSNQSSLRSSAGMASVASAPALEAAPPRRVKKAKKKNTHNRSMKAQSMVQAPTQRVKRAGRRLSENLGL